MFRSGSVPRSVPAGSEIKRFGSVRPVLFGFYLFLPDRCMMARVIRPLFTISNQQMDPDSRASI